jgi:CRP-like cAMP-binding protein
MQRGASLERKRFAPGDTLVEQDEPGDELYLLLDGVLSVEIDGEEVAEVGPGALVGERALLEGGTRKATLRAATPCRVAVVPGAAVDRTALELLSEGRR